MDWIDPWDVIGHFHVVISIHNNPKMSMSTTAASGGNAGSVIAELALEDLEHHIGWSINDLGEFPMGESKVVTHLDTMLTVEESQAIHNNR